MDDQKLSEQEKLQEDTFSLRDIPSLLNQVLNSKPYLAFELFVIFAGTPLIFYLGLVPLPELVTLAIITIVMSIWLFGFARVERYRFDIRLKPETIRGILIRFAFAATVLTGVVLLIEPEHFLYLVIDTPYRWALFLLLYPLLSVIPQELIYRVFFFRRYRSLFTNKYLMVHVNALAFGFLHIIYGNFTAVFITYAIGYVFARTYMRTRSFWAVCLEHTLYGLVIFTIGMGRYFINV